MKKIDPIRAFQTSAKGNKKAEATIRGIEAAYEAQKFKGVPPAGWLPKLAKLIKRDKTSKFSHLAGGRDSALNDLLDGNDALETIFLGGVRRGALSRVAKRGGHISGKSRKDRGQINANAIREQWGRGLHTARQIGKAYALSRTAPNSAEYRKVSATITRFLRRHKVAP